MGRFVTVLLLLTLFVFCRFSYPTPTLCEKIKQRTPKLSNYNFTDELLFKTDRTKLVLLDSTFTNTLFRHDNLEDSTFALGWFDVSSNRMGLFYCYTTYQCDGQRFAYLGLYVFDNCDSVVYEDSYLATTDDDDPNYYDLYAQLSKNNKILTTVSTRTSEWVDVSEDRTKDTLFTQTYKVDLSLAKIDTIYKKATFKLMK